MTFISFAYKLSAADQGKADFEQLTKWTATDSFDVEARAEGNPTKDQMRLMMQSLLAERFKLAAHFETREGPVFALTLVKPGKLGPKLRPHAEGPPCPESYTLQAPGLPIPNEVFPPDCGTAAMRERIGVRTVGSRDTTMALLADVVKAYGGIAGEVDKPVLDKTGLSGRFDFTIEYTPGQNDSIRRVNDLLRSNAANADPLPPPNPEGAPFLNAVRDQLGLKLVRSTGPIRRLVIDHVEWPSEN